MPVSPPVDLARPFTVTVRELAADENYQPGEVVYIRETIGLWCHHHGHLDLERECDYTRPRDDGRRSDRQAIPVRVTITAAIPMPDLDDIT